MRFVEDEEKRKGSFSEEGRTERLLDAFFNTRAEVATMAQELERKRQQKLALEKQMRLIRSLGVWKVLTTLSRVKTGVRDGLSRLRNGV